MFQALSSLHLSTSASLSRRLTSCLALCKLQNMLFASAYTFSYLHLHLAQFSQESSDSSERSDHVLFDSLDKELFLLLMFCPAPMREHICSISIRRWLVWVATA